MKPRLVSISIPLMLFVVAFGLRALYLVQAERNDPNVSVLLPAQDMYQYDVTAKQYVQGNFDFSIRKKLSTSTFYPYLLALLYKVSGSSQRFARLFQVVLSSATVGMLYMIALRFMSKPFAVLCGLVLAFYGVSIYYSALLLPATVILFFYTVMFLFAVEYGETRSKAMLVLAGLTLGLCVVARPNHIIILPFMAAWVVAAEALPAKRGRAHGTLFLVASGVAPAAWVLKTFLVARGTDADLSLGLYGFLVGNMYDSSGIFFDSPASAVEVFASSQGSYVRGVVELMRGIRDHPGQWLWVETRKFAAFWMGFEPSDNISYHVSREFSSLLRLPLPSFGFVSAFGLLGMAVCFRDRRKFSFLYLMTIGAFLSVFIFFVLSRYRLVVVPTLILFAGLAIERIREHLTSRQYARAAGLVVAAVVLLVLTRSANIRFLYPESYLRYFESMARHNAAVAFITQGKPGLGEVQLKRLLESDPHFSHAYATHALLCEAQGRREEAVRIIEQGLRMIPSDQALLTIRASMAPDDEKT